MNLSNHITGDSNSTGAIRLALTVQMRMTLGGCDNVPCDYHLGVTNKP